MPYWSDSNGLSVWEKLDILQPHQMRHNLVNDLHVFGSCVKGHLPHEHPHVPDTTHDDRAEGVFLGNDLTTPNFWMYSFRAKKVIMLSDPKDWDSYLALYTVWGCSPSDCSDRCGYPRYACC